MSKPEKCCDCEYWVEDHKQKRDNKRRGECRKSEPHLGSNGYGYWPMTAYDEFCFAGNKVIKSSDWQILEG